MAPNGRPYLPGYGGRISFIGILGVPSDEWEDGPKHANTNTPTSSRRTCFDTEDSGDGAYAPGMIPSPLGRGLPSRHGYGKSL